ncbi:MAG: hypothetical protein ACYC2H_01500 [Thermoplasmatota archaeon]
MVVCTECGCRTTASKCKPSPEGLDCPHCHDRGSMTSIYTSVYYLDQLDVFERGGQWYWAVAGHYPTGPFSDAEECREDAITSVSWVLDEPGGKPFYREAVAKCQSCLTNPATTRLGVINLCAPCAMGKTAVTR